MKLKGCLSHLPESFKVLLTFTFFLTMMMFSAMIAAFVCHLIYDVDFFSTQLSAKDYTNAGIINAAKLFQLISATGAFIVTPLVVAFLFSHHPGKITGLNVKPVWLTLLPAFALMFMATPFINYLVKVNSLMSLPDFLHSVETWMKASEEEASKITEMFLKADNPADLLINILVIALVPAIGEELMFRGVIQTQLKKLFGNIHVAIFLSAFFFSAMHMQFYGFIPRLVLGMVLGFLFEWSGSLWLPVLAHFVNNASAVLFFYFAQFNQMPFNQDTVGAEQGDFLILIISILVSWLLLFLIKKWSEPHNDATENLSGGID